MQKPMLLQITWIHGDFKKDIESEGTLAVKNAINFYARLKMWKITESSADDRKLLALACWSLEEIT